jgi:hypothetical protein
MKLCQGWGEGGKLYVRIWNDDDMANVQALSQYLPVGTQKTRVNVASLTAEKRNKDLQNKNSEC